MTGVCRTCRSLPVFGVRQVRHRVQIQLLNRFENRSRCGQEAHNPVIERPNARAYTQGLYPSPEGERVINALPKNGLGSC